MRKWRNLAAVFAALCVLACITVPTDARQIRLSDGRFLQGDVVSKNDDGFTFKLTESGGKIFLRWNQVDDALRKELRNEREPDEGLNLKVEVKGSRLELLTGEVFEGNINKASGGFLVINRTTPKNGRLIQVDESEVKEFQRDVDIAATVMMTEEEALKLAERQREPLERAQQHYELALIAERFGLYESAKEYVTSGLGASPDKKLQAVLEAFGTRMDELIRQRELLGALAKAKKEAREKRFKAALELLKEVKKEFKPQGEVLVTFEKAEKEIDEDYTAHVVDQWYKVMRTVAYNKTKERGLTVQSALNWARTQMDAEIQNHIATKCGGDANDIKRRFTGRNRDKISMKRCSFFEDGYYDIVSGHLPSVGRKAVATDNSDENPLRRDDRPRDERSRDDRPRRDREDRYVKPLTDKDFEEIRKALEELKDDADWGDFQAAPPRSDKPAPPSSSGTPSGNKDAKEEDTKKQMEELIRRWREGAGNPSGNGAAPPPNPSVRPDNSGLQVPATVRSIEEWWTLISRQRKADWMVACYVTMGQTMTVYERRYWEVKFK